MQSPGFCHLHVHTQYSLLDGACRIGPMAQKAARLGMQAVAITDHGNMFGVVHFCREMRKAGVKPIIGYEGYFTAGDRRARERGEDLMHLTFLAADQTGYENLVRMSSMAYLEGLYYKPRIDWELLEDCSEGVVCLSGCLHSRVNQGLLTGARDVAAKWLGDMKDLFGPDRFYVELQDHGLPDQKQVLAPAVELAREMGLGIVATNDCHYLEAGDSTWHEVLLCINTRTTLDDPDRFRMATDQLYFKTADEMAALFGDVPEALTNTVRIAEMCNVELDESLKYPTFHHEGIPPEDNAKFLRSLATDNLKERYGELKPEMRERLEHELSVIEELGYVDYFLIVWDFVHFARENGIPVGMRGSACGVLVAHALRMTDVNPMDYGLIFERFMDPARKEQPDIDIDLCEDRREEVIDYVRQRYGEQSTAQIITFGTLKARNCVRDVGRVMGVELSRVDKVAKLIPLGPKVTLTGALKEVKELRTLAANDKEVGRIIQYATKIEGLLRHASTHAAGVVIGDKPLWQMIPLYKMSDSGAMTQWPMDDLAEVGMLKIDFLGLSTLTIIDRTLQNIRQSGHEPPDLDPDKLDLGDPKTYELLSKGLTQGVFQLGSSGMKRLLGRLRPSNIEDVIAVVGLYRPGPLQSGMTDDFIKRRHGHEETVYPHPAFEPILKPTYGVILYQEQIMHICNTIAGMSMADALTLIKAVGKKKESMIRQFRAEFIEGAVANGLAQGTAEEIFTLIMHFAGYGFNKAHTSAYAFIAFTTAYLKAHWPSEFMAASMTCEMGDTDDVVALMRECGQLGIEVLPPDINESREDFTVIGEGVLRFGLGAVKNVGHRAVEAVIAAREKSGSFASLFEFCERVDSHEVTKGAMEALMKAGCFDALPGARAQQLAVLETALKVGTRARKNRQLGQKSLFGAIQEPDPEKRMADNLPDVPPLSQQELARQEHEALGLYVRFDPLIDHRARLERFCTAFSHGLAAVPEGEDTIMGGMVEHVGKRTTRNGAAMAVLKVLDARGQFECVLLPRTYEHYLDLVREGEVFFFAGQVSRERGSLRVDEVIAFDKAQGRLAGAVYVTVPCEDTSPEFWSNVHDVLGRHSGRAPVYIDLASGGFRLRTRVGNGGGVAVTERLADDLEAITGPGSVTFGVQRNGAREAGRDGGRNSGRGGKGAARHADTGS